MNAPIGHSQNSQARQRGLVPGDPQLFEDTSQMRQGGEYGIQQGQPMQPGAFPGSNLINDPMANMAMQYGHSLAGHGKDMLEKNVDKYISISKLKYYFAVDTSYVAKKLALLSFPFTHQEWSVQYHEDTPVAPRFDVNAPDLYIPVMAYVTYILLAGVSLGLSGKFNPEELGMQASSAFVWYAIEICIIMFSLYLVNAKTDLSSWDVISYCGYKYVGMIAILTSGLIFHSTGYWVVLCYSSITITYFSLKTLRLKILPHSADESGLGTNTGGKRRMYLTLFISLIQPLLMYWLTYHLSAIN